jgi:transportin-3
MLTASAEYPVLGLQLQTEFEELPIPAVNSLRESLLGLLVQFAAGPGPVRTQLCLAMAALIAHVPETQWGDDGAIRWLSQRLGAAGQAVALPCMLEMLTVLPQVRARTTPTLR